MRPLSFRGAKERAGPGQAASSIQVDHLDAILKSRQASVGVP